MIIKSGFYICEKTNIMKQISFALVLLLFTASVNAQSKIGTIDAEYIISQMTESATVNAGMEDYNKELQADMETSIKDYEVLVKDYQATSTDMDEETKKEKEAKIIELENKIKGFRQRASVMMQVKRNELTGPLYQKIDAAMQEVVKAEGYTQIFHASDNGLAYSRVEDDITAKVMDKMGITPKPEPAQETTEN